MGLIRDAKDWTKLILYNWLFGIRQPGKWQTMTLKNVPVAPVEELLMRWAGGSVWRGPYRKCPGTRDAQDCVTIVVNNQLMIEH